MCNNKKFKWSTNKWTDSNHHHFDFDLFNTSWASVRSLCSRVLRFSRSSTLGLKPIFFGTKSRFFIVHKSAVTIRSIKKPVTLFCWKIKNEIYATYNRNNNFIFNLRSRSLFTGLVKLSVICFHNVVFGLINFVLAGHVMICWYL